MKKEELQKRCLVLDGMQVREGEDSRVIEGCAIVFNQETTLWDGKYYREREIISPLAVTADFLREQDVKLNLMHNRNETLCRNNKGVGTLQLELRTDGLYFSAEMPKCDIGDRALELCRNKTLTGCSFEFWPEEYNEQVTTLPDGREDTLITHTKFKSLTALTIALDPAYANTSVSARENELKTEREAAEKAEQEKREAAEREKKTRDRKLRELQSDFDAEAAIDNRKDF